MTHPLRTALVLALTLLAGAAVAADEAGKAADEAAMLAYEVHEDVCADLASNPDTKQSGEQAAVVTDAWKRLGEAWDRTGRYELLYWRGVLSQCLGQQERAARDLTLFVELDRFDEAYRGLVDNARTRLKRMKVEVREPSEEEIAAAKAAREAGGAYSPARDAPALRVARVDPLVPAVVVAAGAGYQRTGLYDYVLVAVDLSFRLKGPLRLWIAARPAWSQSWTTPDGATAPTGSYQLFAGLVGAELQFNGRLRPRVGLAFQIAPFNTSEVGGPQVLPGIDLEGGVDLPLGTPTVAIRVAGGVGNLGPMVTARASGALVVALEPPRKRR